jgi:hypothetical protein
MAKWTFKSESLTAFWTSIDTIVEVRKELIGQNREMIKKGKIQHLRRCITCFDFVLILKFIHQVLLKTKTLADKPQTEQLDLVISKTRLRVTCKM